MELTINRDDAVAAMTKAHGVVTRTMTVPILQHVLLRTDADGLTIQACDTLMECVSPTPATVTKPGETTVPAQPLYEMLRALPAGGQLSMTLTEAPERLRVQCGRSRLVLPTLPAADFPKFDIGQATHRATLPAKHLAQLIDRVAFAQGREQTRYYFCGVYLHTVVEDGVTWLRAVATDGSRLGYDQVDGPAGWATAPGLILPSKTVAEARRLIDGLAGDVEMWTDGQLWGLAAGGLTLASKLIDGTYPDYVRVIPRSPETHLTLDADGLSSALKRCGIMVSSASKTSFVRLALDAEGLTLRSRDGQGGEIEEQIEADYDGPARELTFNSSYLLELAAQMSGESLSLGLGGNNDAALVTDPLHAAAAYVCMPVRA